MNLKLTFADVKPFFVDIRFPLPSFHNALAEEIAMVQSETT